MEEFVSGLRDECYAPLTKVFRSMYAHVRSGVEAAMVLKEFQDTLKQTSVDKTFPNLLTSSQRQRVSRLIKDSPQLTATGMGVQDLWHNMCVYVARNLWRKPYLVEAKYDRLFGKVIEHSITTFSKDLWDYVSTLLKESESSESKTESSEPEPETEFEFEPEPEPEPVPEQEPECEAEPEFEPESEQEPEPEPEQESEPELEPEQESEPELEPEPEPEQEPEPGPELEPEQEPEPGPELEPEQEPEHEYEYEQEQEPEQESKPEHESEAEAEQEEPEQELEPVHESEAEAEQEEPEPDFNDFDPELDIHELEVVHDPAYETEDEPSWEFVMNTPAPDDKLRVVTISSDKKKKEKKDKKDKKVKKLPPKEEKALYKEHLEKVRRKMKKSLIMKDDMSFV
jgi:hypothetical protein